MDTILLLNGKLIIKRKFNKENLNVLHKQHNSVQFLDLFIV